jgi:hypothetical protein
LKFYSTKKPFLPDYLGVKYFYLNSGVGCGGGGGVGCGGGED